MDRLEYDGSLLNIRQLIGKVLSLRLSFQTSFDNSVLFSYFLFLKLVRWFTSRCLNGVLVKPVCFRHGGVVGVHDHFIKDTASQILPVKGAIVRVSTVAAPRLVIALVFCPTYMGIMALNNSAHIRHAAVADYDCASIKYLM